MSQQIRVWRCEICNRQNPLSTLDCPNGCDDSDDDDSSFVQGESRTWSCETCTFVNENSTSRTCSMCQTTCNEELKDDFSSLSSSPVPSPILYERKPPRRKQSTPSPQPPIVPTDLVDLTEVSFEQMANKISSDEEQEEREEEDVDSPPPPLRVRKKRKSSAVEVTSSSDSDSSLEAIFSKPRAQQFNSSSLHVNPPRRTVSSSSTATKKRKLTVEEKAERKQEREFVRATKKEQAFLTKVEKDIKRGAYMNHELVICINAPCGEPVLQGVRGLIAEQYPDIDVQAVNDGSGIPSVTWKRRALVPKIPNPPTVMIAGEEVKALPFDAIDADIHKVYRAVVLMDSVLVGSLYQSKTLKTVLAKYIRQYRGSKMTICVHYKRGRQQLDEATLMKALCKEFYRSNGVLNFSVCRNVSNVCEFIVCASRAMSKAYYDAQDNQLVLADSGQTKYQKGAGRSKSHGDVYINMLRQVDRCSEDIAGAIAAKYPSMQNLIAAYAQCRDQHQREGMLEKIQYSARRKIGPVLSKKFAILMWSHDHTMLVTNPEG